MRKQITRPLAITFSRDIPGTLNITEQLSVNYFELVIGYNINLEGKSIVIEGKNNDNTLFTETVNLKRGKKIQIFKPNISLTSFITEVKVKALSTGRFSAKLTVISNGPLSTEAESIKKRIEGIVGSTRKNNLKEWSIGFSVSYNCFSRGNFGYMQQAPNHIIEEVIEHFTINLDLKALMRLAEEKKMSHVRSYYLYVEHNRH